MRSALVCAIAFVLAAGADGALADSISPPRSYKAVAPGGQYVFVMISPSSWEPDSDALDADIRELRRTYAQSGMYRNDGSAEPLWTVDWFAYGGVECTSNGAYVIRHGHWPVLPGRDEGWESALQQEALTFIANGQLLHTYQIRDLVGDPGALPRTAGHFTFMKNRILDDERHEYELWTADGNHFMFDLRTGAIISETRATPTRRTNSWLWWAGAGVAVAAGRLAWIAWRSRRGRDPLGMTVR